MADTKITALTALTAADPSTDVLPIVDTSDTTMAASGTTKKISINNILGASGTATLASATITGALGAAGLNVTGSTIPANGVYLGSANNLSFSAASALGMTLNSSGLGVGRSPSYRLQASSGTKATTASLATVAGITTTDADDFGIYFRLKTDATGANRYAAITSFDNGSGNGARDLVLQDLGGNVGIGVTPSAWNSNYNALDIGQNGNISGRLGTSNTVDIVSNGYRNSAGNWVYKLATSNTACRYQLDGSTGGHIWYSGAAGTAGNTIAGFSTATMTLDASGNLNLGVTSSLINTTRRLSVSGTVAAALQSTGAATVETINVWHTATSGNNIFVDFDTEAAVTSRGSISYNRAGGLVAYNTTSDYRAKDIIGPVSNSGSLIDSLKVYVGKMKGATIERPMLIAHETQEVAPYAVTGTKDEVDADGKPKYQQMDASALVPLLIAEIQSLRARVQTLETR